MHCLVNKIEVLKSVVIRWEIGRKKSLREELFHLEEEINVFHNTFALGIFYEQDHIKLTDLKERRFQIIQVE